MSADSTQRGGQSAAETALRPESEAERSMAEARARLDAALFRRSAAEMALAGARRDAACRDAAAAFPGLFGALGAMIMAAIKLVLLVLLYRAFIGF